VHSIREHLKLGEGTVIVSRSGYLVVQYRVMGFFFCNKVLPKRVRGFMSGRRFSACSISRSTEQIIVTLLTDKSSAPPGRTQANVSVRIARISFGALPCRKKKKKLDDSSRLDVDEIARVPDTPPNLFPSGSG